MLLMVGLGNPGAQYAANRHNIGFMALDRIAADHGFSPWRARFQGLAAEGRLGEARVTLLKPQTFMNLSGQSVGEAMRYLKLTPAEVIVLHDELDLPPGRCRVKTGGGHAGHNGLRSIHQHVGEGYRRLRIGIGHPGHKDRVTGHVLSDFAKAEAGMLDDLLRGISDGAPALAAGDDGRFGSALAARTGSAAAPRAAPRPSAPQPARPPAGLAPDPQPAAGSAGDALGALRDRFR
ncbi:aminoacyl-tRNA hydrolase [Paracoccus endophyticus]|uniref:aminoacyl-tRNA hydrolase n=1 Tax=Paracoccus endophyticus TaxID=2233774 RepID=UPI000DD9BEB5|nr:aminoacyl-tRNA hydrolase [Paracoccus endophyticus]